MRNIDIATEVFVFQWGCFGASLEVMRDKTIALGIAEKQVVFRRNLEEMQDLFHQLAQFCDLHRFEKRKDTLEAQLASEEILEHFEKKRKYDMEKSIANEVKMFLWNNAQPSLEELQNIILNLNIAKYRVVIKKSREKMESLLYQLSLFSEYIPVLERNVSAEEKKEVQKLMRRVEKKRPLREVKGIFLY